LLDELHNAALRIWGDGVNDLAPDDYVQMLLMLSLDRIHRGETRGFARRRPAQPVVLDAARMKQGIG